MTRDAWQQLQVAAKWMSRSCLPLRELQVDSQQVTHGSWSSWRRVQLAPNEHRFGGRSIRRCYKVLAADRNFAFILSSGVLQPLPPATLVLCVEEAVPT
ncbi:hypothetical protein PC116_g14061 [Phytophthora cactorum]|nr:hypothetical protein PC116_g14061 [Phytophthora cactorum]